MSEPVFVAHPDGRFYKVQDSKPFVAEGFYEVGRHRAGVEMFYRSLSAAGTDEPEAPSLNSLTVAQLDALAAERGIQFTDDMKKADKVAAIEEAG